MYLEKPVKNRKVAPNHSLPAAFVKILNGEQHASPRLKLKSLLDFPFCLFHYVLNFSLGV